MSKAIVFKTRNNEKIYPCPYYPIGSIYISVNSTNPSTYFGGSWIQIKDRFLLACGSTYSNGSTGGEANHSLSNNELPSHNHSGTTGYSGTHNHTMRYGSSTGSGVNISTAGSTYGVLDLTSWRWTTADWVSNVYTTDEGSHYHSFTTGNTGGSQAHNNMPPYLAVYVWKRVS